LGGHAFGHDIREAVDALAKLQVMIDPGGERKPA
jgi:hypothetical protein